MIFFFAGLPRRLLYSQISLSWVSFASEPELAKKTRAIGAGASSRSFAASKTAGSFAAPAKPW